MSSIKSIIFRKLNHRDVYELHTMLVELSENAKNFFHPHTFEIDTLLSLNKNKDHYFILLYNQKIIGYSMLRLFGTEIPSFGCCIRDGYEGLCYGTLLTRWTIDYAKKLGYKSIILKVHKENTVAINLYRKFNFIATGEIPEKNEIKMEIHI